MKCPSCQAECPADAKFCSQCGRKFERACHECGGPVDPADRFCGECGASLLRDGASAATEPDRRPITALFCDLVGSTSLSVAMDPEDLRDLIRSYQERSAHIIARFGGYISRFMGDGILLWFGYPAAQEDAAERAARQRFSP